MRIEGGLLDRVRRIKGVLEVLVDEEDLYVYSLEKPLYPRLRRRPSAVVKVEPEDVEDVVRELASLGLSPALRGGEWSEGAVVVDGFKPPDLQELDVEASALEERREALKRRVVDEALKIGLDTPRRLSIALEAFVKSRQAEECRECRVCSGYCTVAPFFNYVETWTLSLIHI